MNTSIAMGKTLYGILLLSYHLFKSLVILVNNPKVNLLLGTQSPHYFCVLHIVSNFVFAMLLICEVTQIKFYEYMCNVAVEIGSMLIIEHEFTVYYPSLKQHLQASSIIHF